MPVHDEQIHKFMYKPLCPGVQRLHRKARPIVRVTIWQCHETGHETDTKPQFRNGSGENISAIAYLFNNPVEKHLCSKAEQYKWNFLAHYGKHPSVRKADCSNRLRRSMSLAEETFRRKRYLNHALLNTMMKDLTSEEKNKLADHIISIYFPFDIKRTTDCYGSYEEMLIAINSNTGSEYEIIETEYCRSDKPYRDIISFLHKKGIKDMHSVICMDNENKLALMQDIKAHTSASYTQIRKFLHIQPLKRHTKPTRQLSN